MAANRWMTAFLSFVPEGDGSGLNNNNSSIKQLSESKKNGELKRRESGDDSYENVKERNNEWNLQFYGYLNSVGHSDEDIKSYEYKSLEPWVANHISLPVRPNPKINCLLASFDDLNDIIDSRFDEDNFATGKPKKKADSTTSQLEKSLLKFEEKGTFGDEEDNAEISNKSKATEKKETKVIKPTPEAPKPNNTEDLKCPVCSHMNSSKWHYVRHVNQCKTKAKSEIKRPSPTKKPSPIKKFSPSKKTSAIEKTPKAQDPKSDYRPQRNAAARAVASFLEEEVEDPEDLKAGVGITPGVSVPLPIGDDFELFKGLGFDDNDEESFLTQEWKELAGDFKLNESDDELAEELLKNWSTDDLLAETLLNKKKEDKAKASGGLTDKAKYDSTKSNTNSKPSMNIKLEDNKGQQANTLRQVRTPKQANKQEEQKQDERKGSSFDASLKSATSSGSSLRQVRPPNKEKTNVTSTVTKTEKDQIKKEQEKTSPGTTDSSSRRYKCQQCNFSNDLKFEIDFHVKMKHFKTNPKMTPSSPLSSDKHNPYTAKSGSNEDYLSGSKFSSKETASKKQDIKSPRQPTKTISSDVTPNRGIKRESDLLSSLANNNNVQKRSKLESSPKSKNVIGKKDVNQNDWRPATAPSSKPTYPSWPTSKSDQSNKPKVASATSKVAMLSCNQCDFESSSQLNLNTHIIIMH